MTSDPLAEFIRALEDYAVRHYWSQDDGADTAPDVRSALVFDLSGEKVRAVQIVPRSDGGIQAERRSFERVYLADSIPSGVQDEVDDCMWARVGSQNWRLCDRAALPNLRQKGNDCIESIWRAPVEQFPDLLWGLIRWQIDASRPDQLWFLLKDTEGARAEVVRTALRSLAVSQPSHADLFQQATGLLRRPAALRGFAFLDDLQRLPEEGEQMLLLYAQADRAELFRWAGCEFSCSPLGVDQSIDLDNVHRLAVCSTVVERAVEGVQLFNSYSDLDNYAIAHYVVWQPVLREWEVTRRRRAIQQLQRRVEQMGRENQKLELTVERAQSILERLRKEPDLNLGGDLCQRSELTSAPPLP